jgi:hypothetical protein
MYKKVITEACFYQSMEDIILSKVRGKDYILYLFALWNGLIVMGKIVYVFLML